jgi:hypothetical protein
MCIAEMNRAHLVVDRIQSVLLGMQNRTLVPYLARTIGRCGCQGCGLSLPAPCEEAKLFDYHH